MENSKNPNEFDIKDEGITLKLSKVGLSAAIVRSAIDLGKGALSSGTIPEWIKVIDSITIKGSKEQQTYLLVGNAMVLACKIQIQDKIDQVEIDSTKRLVTNNKLLRFEIFKGLKDNDYVFNRAYINNPTAFPLIADFKPFYEEWLSDSFDYTLNAKEISSDFKYYFASCLLELLTENKNGTYDNLLTWYQNPIQTRQHQLYCRQMYLSTIKKAYHGPALGESDLCLSDVYIEPNFRVFDQMLPEKHAETLRYQHNISGQDHFLPTNYPISIHMYLNQYFFTNQRSKFINAQEEESRFLILLGQPGHGKSSFCYRCINDLLQSTDFYGQTFFIKLQDANKRILDFPEDEINKMLSDHKINFREWIDKTNKQSNVLFLDGLDELYMTQSLSDIEVLNLLTNCEKWLQRNPYLYIIITARFNYVNAGQLHSRNRMLLSLDYLNIQKQSELIHKYKLKKKLKKCNLEPEVLERIVEGDKFKHVVELIQLPILLQMILISKIDLESADSKSTIYDRLFKTILNRKWDKDKRLKKYKDDSKFEPKHLRNYLAYLAYKIYQGNKGYINQNELNGDLETERFATKYLLKAVNKEQGLRDVLKDIMTSFYLKESRKVDANAYQEYAIEFLHKSLYEYLASDYIWKKVKKFFLEKDEDGDLKEHSSLEVLQAMESIFSHTRLSSETIAYLTEIIANDHSQHTELAAEMGKHFPKLMDFGFISRYNNSDGKKPTFTPDKQVLHVFHGYYLILGELNWQPVFIDTILPAKWIDSLNVSELEIDKAELLAIYQQDQEKSQKMLEGIGRWHKLIEAKFKEERDEVKHWLTENYPEVNSIIKYPPSWFIRHQLKQKMGKLQKAKIKAINKKPTAFIRYFAMNKAVDSTRGLNWHFLNLSRQSFIQYSGANLQGIGVNLSYANLSYADFRGANLRGANLRGANLNGVDLSNANLRNADFRGADFRDADLRDADFREADLRYSIFLYADLCGVDFREADLRYANLCDVDFCDAGLWGIDFRSADLCGASLCQANLQEADLREADLCNADLCNADLRNADLREADLRNADLREADLRNADLTNAIVSTKNWLEQLVSRNTKGYRWLIETYTVGQEEEHISEQYKGEQIYRIIKNNE